MDRRLLETDQVNCYDHNGQQIPCDNSGQDASYHKNFLQAHQRRFHSLGPVVKDEFTGAIWTKNANPAKFPLSWTEARQYVKDLREQQTFGYDAWQLPDRSLLFSIISHQNKNPVLLGKHPFIDVFPGYYWTNDITSRIQTQVWYIHLGGGRVHKAMKHGSYMVWPVCPDHAANLLERQRFVVNGACVQDNRTGLIWSNNADPVNRPLNWQSALNAITELNHIKWEGFNDWRLPNIRELESITDLKYHSPAITKNHPFSNIREAYWSSTTSVYEPSYAWTLYSQDGFIGVGYKNSDNDFYLWPLRG